MFATMRLRKNRSIKWIMMSSISILILIFNIPWLRKAFNLTSLNMNEWVIAIVTGIGSVMWFEIYKVLRSRNRVLAEMETTYPVQR